MAGKPWREIFIFWLFRQLGSCDIFSRVSSFCCGVLSCIEWPAKPWRNIVIFGRFVSLRAALAFRAFCHFIAGIVPCIKLLANRDGKLLIFWSFRQKESCDGFSRVLSFSLAPNGRQTVTENRYFLIVPPTREGWLRADFYCPVICFHVFVFYLFFDNKTTKMNHFWDFEDPPVTPPNTIVFKTPSMG